MTKPNSEGNQTVIKDDLLKIGTSEIIDVNCLNYWAVKILCTSDPFEKVNLTNFVAQKWKNNELTIGSKKFFVPPDQPHRKEELKVIDSAKIKRGKGGTLVIHKIVIKY